MTTIEIDHRTVDALRTLRPEQRGVGYVHGADLYFEVRRDRDQSLNVWVEQPETEERFFFNLSPARVLRHRAQDLTAFVARLVETARGL